MQHFLRVFQGDSRFLSLTNNSRFHETIVLSEVIGEVLTHALLADFTRLKMHSQTLFFEPCIKEVDLIARPNYRVKN